MRDFVSGFATGFAGGVTQGAKLGLAARELRDDKEAKAAENLRKQLADQATAEYRAGQLGIAGQNAATARGRLAVSQGNAKETSRHNKLMEIVADRNATSGERRAAAAELKASGIDTELETHLGGTVPDYTPKTVGGAKTSKGAVTTPPATGAVTPPAATGAITTPPAVTTPPAPAATGGDKSITEESQFSPVLKGAFGEAGETGEDPDEED